MKSLRLFLLLSLPATLAACKDNDPGYSGPLNDPGDNVQVTHAEQFLMDAKAFDLETVIGLLKSGKVKDAKELQDRVNDPAAGINNVDIDGDGKIDYVGVKEETNNNQRSLVFGAYQSSKITDGGMPEPTPIASVNFNVNGDQVNVVGGYPPYVRGYNDYSYSYNQGYHDGLFMAWLLSPRPMYVSPIYPSYYVARPVYGYDRMVQTRTTYRTTTSVGPVTRSAPPSTFRMQSADKVRSSLASGNKSFGTMRDFQVKGAGSPTTSRSGSSFGSSSWGGSTKSSGLPGGSTRSTTGSSSTSGYGTGSSTRSSGSWFGGSSSRPSTSTGSGSSFGSSRSSGSSFGSGRSFGGGSSFRSSSSGSSFRSSSFGGRR